MADDKSKTGKPNRDRINVEEPYELRQWANHFGVDDSKILAAVAAVGPMVVDVARRLGKSAH